MVPSIAPGTCAGLGGLMVYQEGTSVGGSVDQLVVQAVAGDEAALTALLHEHGAQVRGALDRAYRGRLAGQADLDDVMQITYLEAYLGIQNFVPGAPNGFRRWLQRIGENNVRDAIRRSDGARRSAGAPSPACGEWGCAVLELLAASGTPSRTAAKDEVQRLLETAIERLPEDYGRVLRLHDLEGHSGPEVARLIGRSHGAVKMLLARARDRLTDLLGPASDFLSGRG